MRFIVEKDHRGEWRWTLKANNGEDIAVSSEGYVRRDDCLHGVELVLSTSVNTPIEIREHVNPFKTLLGGR